MLARIPPLQVRRCTVSGWTYVTGKVLPHSNDPYAPVAAEVEEVTKVRGGGGVVRGRGGGGDEEGGRRCREREG